jgi:LysW-gamma-L-lysine carboxypeptidase
LNHIDFLDSIIKTPSPSLHEAKVAKICEKYMKQLAFEKVWIDKAGNVIATNYDPKEAENPDLLLFGHTDTVPIPMEYKRERGRIQGRGAVDAKSSLAAMITAGGETKVPYKLMVAGVTCEESPVSKGAIFLIKKWKPKMAINGEPSKTNGVTIAYKGRMVVECRTHGKASHAGMASENPIERTIEYYQKLRSVYPLHKNNFDNVILNVTQISGGSHSALNVVPQELHFDIDVRIPPSISTEEVAKTFKSLAPQNVSVKISGVMPGVEMDLNHKLCKAMVAAIRDAGLQPRYVRKSGTADMNMTIDAGIPTVAYGPGNSDLDHTPNEYILLEDYEKGIAVLKKTMLNLK